MRKVYRRSAKYRRYRKRSVRRYKKGMYRYKPMYRIMTYPYKLTVNYVSITMGALGALNYGAIAPRLFDIPQHAEYTAMYDQYKITGLKFKFIPLQNTANVARIDAANNSYPNTQLPYLYVVIDNDDNNNITTINDMLQYQNVKYVPCYKKMNRYIVPTTLGRVFETAVGDGYTTKRRQWLDCDDTDIPHYGIKWLLSSATPTGAANPFAGATMYNVFVTYYIKFRTVR